MPPRRFNLKLRLRPSDEILIDTNFMGRDIIDFDKIDVELSDNQGMKVEGKMPCGTVVVDPVVATSIIILPVGSVLSVGNTQQFSVFAVNGSGQIIGVLSPSQLQFFVDNPAAFSISASGLLTIISYPVSGTGTITVVHNNLQTSVTFSVLEVPAEIVSIDIEQSDEDQPTQLLEGKTRQLVVQAFDEFGNIIPTTNVDYSFVSGDPTKLTVNAAGLLTAIAEADVTVTVTHVATGLADDIVIAVRPNVAPTADYVVENINGLTATFRSISTDGTGIIALLEWDFDDGSPIVTGIQVTHTFPASGSYDVKLTATDDGTLFDDETKAVSVTRINTPPTASFTLVVDPIDPLKVTVNASASVDPDGTIAAYRWDWGDGTLATGMTAERIFQTDGDKTITLEVEDNEGAIATEIKTVTLDIGGPPANLPPVAKITIVSINDLTVQVSGATSSDPDGTITDYAWFYGDGNVDSGATPVPHEYLLPGQYTISLIVTDDDGTPATSTATIEVSVAPVNQDPVSNFSFTGTNPIQFTDLSSDPDPTDHIAAWLWNFGDGTTSTQRNPSKTFQSAGDYTVSLKVTDSRGAFHISSQVVTAGAVGAIASPHRVWNRIAWLDYRTHYSNYSSVASMDAERTYVAERCDLIIGGQFNYSSRNPTIEQYIYDIRLWHWNITESIPFLNDLYSYITSRGGNIEDAFVHYQAGDIVPQHIDDTGAVITQHTASGQKLKRDRIVAQQFAGRDYWYSNVGYTLFREWRKRRTQNITANRSGIFWDVMQTSAITKFIKFPCLEYSTSTTYLSHFRDVIIEQRPLAPAGRHLLNTAQYANQPANMQNQIDSGGVMMEFVNSPYRSSLYWNEVETLAANNCKVHYHAAVNTSRKNVSVNGSTPGIYSTIKERCLMFEYCSYLMCVNPAAMDMVVFDPYNEGWPQYPFSSVWLEAYNYNIGLATARRSIFKSGTDPVGQNYDVWRRTFQNGFVLCRPQKGTNQGDSSAATVALPSGNWKMLQPDGTLGGLVSSINLRNGESAIFIAS